MTGIYLHIPFCKKACHYCNFHFSTGLKNKAEMVNAIAKEIVHPYFPETAFNVTKEKIDTIYFGGGTPSLLHFSELNLLLETIQKNYIVNENAEITLEANPDDISDEKLMEWKQAGINRLSIGVQSFRNEDLVWMNRAHHAEQSINSLKAALDKGFSNISIDLIYGLPQLSNHAWQQNVEQALALNIPHLSCYALTVEPKTALENFIHSGKIKPVNPEAQSEQFLLLMDWLAAANYQHYEISNFAKEGFRSQHNSSYWQGKPYLGFGPSAHSFDGEKTRWWNVANNAFYLMNKEELTMRNDGQSTHHSQLIIHEEEVLTPEQIINEYIMISLRTIEGINLERLQDKTIAGTTFEAILKRIKKWEFSNKIILKNGFASLTNQGKLFADGIAADLFV